VGRAPVPCWVSGCVGGADEEEAEGLAGFEGFEGVEEGEDGMKETDSVPEKRTMLTASATGNTATSGFG